MLDRQGRFWHDGERVAHPGMQLAFASWIDRHPDDGRFILQNGYDWTYFSVEDVPFFIRAVKIGPAGVFVVLSDDTREALDLSSMTSGANDALYARVKSGRFEARFTPQAQTSLGQLVVETEAGGFGLQHGTRVFPVGRRAG